LKVELRRQLEQKNNRGEKASRAAVVVQANMASSMVTAATAAAGMGGKTMVKNENTAGYLGMP